MAAAGARKAMTDPFEALRADADLVRAEQAWRDELRAEAEEYEALAARDLARSRSLVDVAIALCHRGDVVEVSLAGATFRGEVTYAAGDLACLSTAAGEVDVRLGAPLLLRVVQRTRRGGRPLGRGPSSFTARLAEYEATGERLLVGLLPTGAELDGRVAAVAVDHVLLDTAHGDAVHVAATAVGWVRRPLPDGVTGRA